MHNFPYSIEIKNLSKSYKINVQSSKTFYALNNINIQLHKGESLGIVGKNGSGKSTLLKIISGITSPTEGEITYHGRLLSIIDIGSGFHPELSGRDNILLYSTFLGISDESIKSNILQIIEFSELGQFIEVPVKKYSNGMYLRLAFSIVLFSEVDILVLDEIISVGDQSFMAKCYEKIEQLRCNGVSLILVSHNLSDIYKYTDKCVWLENGKIKEQDKSSQIISMYQLSLFESIFIRYKQSSQEHFIEKLQQYNNQYIKIELIKIFQLKAEKNSEFEYEEDIFIECQYFQQIDDGFTDIVYTILNVQMQPVYVTSSILSGYTDKIRGETRVKTRCIIPGKFLNVGYYTISVRFMKNEKIELLHIPNAYSFKIITHNKILMAKLITTTISISAINQWTIESN